MATTYLLMLDRLQSLLGGSGFRRAYTPYGVLFSGRAPSLAYCGQLRDPSTGNYHLGNGHRTFDPLLMRFHSPDRLSPFGAGGLNAYSYCMGDPVNRNDPSGRAATLNVALYTAGGYASGKLHEHLLTLWNMYSYSIDRAKAMRLEPQAGRELPAVTKRDVGQAIFATVTSFTAFGVAVGGTYRELQMSAKAGSTSIGSEVSDPIGEIVLPLLNLLTAGASKLSDAMAGDLNGKYKRRAQAGAEKVDELTRRSSTVRQGNDELSETRIISQSSA